MEKGKIKPGKKGYFEILFNGKLALVSPVFRGKNLAFVLTAYRTRKKA
jgi:hypothetical protein